MSSATRTRVLRRLTDMAAPWGLSVTCTREECRGSPWHRLTLGTYFGAVRFDDGAVTVRGLGPGGTDVQLPIPQHRRAEHSVREVGRYLIERRVILARIAAARLKGQTETAQREAADRLRWGHAAKRGEERVAKRKAAQAEVDSTIRLLGLAGTISARADEFDRVELVFPRIDRAAARELILYAIAQEFVRVTPGGQ